MIDASLPPGGLLAATVAADLGLAALVGAWASLHWLEGATSPWAGQARARSSRVLRAASVATLAADLVRLWLQAADMADVALPDALALLPSVLGQTSAGRAGGVGLAGLGIVVWASHRPVPHGRRSVLHAVGLGLFVAGRAAVSHAGAQGFATPWVLAECLHLAAVGLWCGAVGMAAFCVLPLRAQGTDDAADTVRWIARLSGAATLAVLVIGATGVLAAWRGVGSTDALAHSAYGGVLLVKLGFVGVAVGLGGFNRWRVMPGLSRALRGAADVSAQRWQRRFVHVLHAEAVALFGALVAAFLLAASPSPAAM